MKQIVIDSDSHPLYATFKDLYRVSFPIFEQRSESQQAQAFKNHKYKLLAFTEEHTFLGFIAYWQFDSYRYVEHFAINADLRGKGYGSRVLNEFTHSAPETVILEIDPIQDDVTEARWRFYEKCGFCKNPYTHLHPPYNKEAYSPHALVVLSSEKGKHSVNHVFSSPTSIINFTSKKPSYDDTRRSGRDNELLQRAQNDL